ncbi:hypothetical protein EDE05_1096 [Neorhizobium sp. R1-B]|nr:hypothetical protein EDE05_1096 [Neorhizobium sp. R1-B]
MFRQRTTVASSKPAQTLAAIPIDGFILPNSLCEEQSLYAVDVEDSLGNQRFPLSPNPSVVVFLGCQKLDH